MESCLSSSSDSGDDDSQPSPIHYYQDDPHLPVFSRDISGYRVEQVARILLNPHVDEQKVCNVQPMGVVRNATFFIDLDDIKFGNLKADHLGAWKASGTKTAFFRVLPSGSIYIASLKPNAQRRASYYVPTHRYYVCPQYIPLVSQGHH